MGKIPALMRSFGEVLSGKGRPDGRFISVEEIEGMIDRARSGLLGDKAESLKGKKYLIEQLIARGYHRSEIADRLGMSRKTVYNILHRIDVR